MDVFFDGPALRFLEVLKDSRIFRIFAFLATEIGVREKSKLSKPSKPSKPHTLTWYLHNKVPNSPSLNNHQTKTSKKHTTFWKIVNK